MTGGASGADAPTQPAGTGPTPTPVLPGLASLTALETLGDDDAGTCVDGVCAVPGG
ncbi:hypothetical protein [Cellulomonas fimi]|uniref:Uncharacterized protein n=1 Tax=Cellulomonas fimi TaxID=1708 RepID=A0A7Y0QHV4_CELFI|nr:hypothetical protein [Cellulomonas fimi]NMR20685.1 hypothetical protein [Cellulomonas fimi]